MTLAISCQKGQTGGVFGYAPTANFGVTKADFNVLQYMLKLGSNALQFAQGLTQSLNLRTIVVR
jgi:hypothetical protein